MQHRQNSEMSSPLSAHNPRNESNSFLPRVPVNWETHLNWLHSSVNHLHTRKLPVPRGQLCRVPPCLRLSKAEDVLEVMSKHRQGLVLLTKWGLWGWTGFCWIIGIRSPRQSVTEGSTNPAALPPNTSSVSSNTPTERSLVWNLEPHRQKGRGSKNNCLYPSLLTFLLFHPHNLPSRMYSVNQWEWVWKLKYPRLYQFTYKADISKRSCKRQGSEEPAWKSLSCYETLLIFHLQQEWTSVLQWSLKFGIRSKTSELVDDTPEQ